uniref:Uncharacterized protein n=1 Tax=Salarias fasciatus TaxID=181472 RepID=A0A672IMM9_SALFA
DSISVARFSVFDINVLMAQTVSPNMGVQELGDRRLLWFIYNAFSHLIFFISVRYKCNSAEFPCFHKREIPTQFWAGF